MFSIGKLGDIKEFKEISLQKILVFLYLLLLGLGITKQFYPNDFIHLNNSVTTIYNSIKPQIINIAKLILKLIFISSLTTLVTTIILFALYHLYWEKYWEKSEFLTTKRYTILLNSASLYLNFSMWYILFLLYIKLFDYNIYFPKIANVVLFFAPFYLLIKFMHFLLSNTE